MAPFLYGQYSDFEKLVIDIKNKQNGNVYVSYLKLDDNSLVTPENTPVWARYLRRKLEGPVTKEAMESEELKEKVKHLSETTLKSDEGVKKSSEALGIWRKKNRN